MPIPTWAVGQVLTASDVNTWFVPQAVVKPGDTTRTGTTALDDPDLVLPLAANATYLFTGFIRFLTSAVGGWFQMTWTVPTGTIMRYGTPVYANQAGTIIYLPVFAGADNVLVQGTGGGFNEALNLSGTITTAGTAGNVRLQWALGSGSGGNITIQQYSWLNLQRVA